MELLTYVYKSNEKKKQNKKTQNTIQQYLLMARCSFGTNIVDILEICIFQFDWNPVYTSSAMFWYKNFKNLQEM